MELHMYINRNRMGTSSKPREELTIAPDHRAPDEDEDRPQFQSTFGLIVSCMGCVVGTGNIWRFPRIVANNSEDGGLVFLIVWLLFLFLWSTPLLLIEYGTGRYTKKAVVGSFRAFLNDNHIWCGAWVSLVSFFISCYYAVVLGWCFYYFVYYVGHELPEDEVIALDTYKSFAEDSYWPILTHFIAIFLAGLSVTKGVKTIEKVNLVLVPALLLIIIFTFVWSLTREYADYGIKFLFTPDWKTFGEPRLWVDAVSQNAFDTGAGAGLLIPYATYMTRKHGIVKYGHLIPAANNLVSLICGITIFSTVFSTLILSRGSITESQIVDIVKDSGPASTGLTFIWIPVLFSTVGVMGRVLACLFFLCLSFAGLTSLMANFELFTQTFEDFGVRRRYGMPIVIFLTFSVGLASALNINVLANQDFVWGFALVVNGLIFMYMIARVGAEKFREICVNRYSDNDWKLTRGWTFIIRVVAPIEAVVLIGWWAVDLITADSDGGDEWYEYGRETLVTTITQWIGVMLLMIIANYIYVRWSRRNGTLIDDTEEAPLLRSGNHRSSSSSLVASEKSRDLDGSIRELRL